MDTTSGDARTLTVDVSLPRTLARAHQRWMLTRGPWIAILAIAALFVVGSVTFWAFTGRSAVLAFIAIWILVVVVGAPLLSYRTTLRSIRSAYPEGSTVEASVTDGRLRISSALGASEVSLSAIRTLHVSGEALILGLSHARGAAWVLPAAVFTDSDIRTLAEAAVRR